MGLEATESWRRLLFSLVPVDGTAIGNKALREQLAQAAGGTIDESLYLELREPLLAAGELAKGQGRGGSVRRLRLGVQDAGALLLQAQVIPEALKQPAPRQEGMRLGQSRPPAARPRASDPGDARMLSYRHNQKRVNNPEVGMVTPDTDTAERERRWTYDPHIDPALQFDVDRAGIERLIDDALASGEPDTMREALATLKRMAEPYLNWAGKAERTRFEIDTVSLPFAAGEQRKIAVKIVDDRGIESLKVIALD